MKLDSAATLSVLPTTSWLRRRRARRVAVRHALDLTCPCPPPGLDDMVDYYRLGNLENRTENRMEPKEKLTKVKVAGELHALQAAAELAARDPVSADDRQTNPENRREAMEKLTKEQMAGVPQALQTATEQTARDLVLANDRQASLECEEKSTKEQIAGDLQARPQEPKKLAKEQTDSERMETTTVQAGSHSQYTEQSKPRVMRTKEEKPCEELKQMPSELQVRQSTPDRHATHKSCKKPMEQLKKEQMAGESLETMADQARKHTRYTENLNKGNELRTCAPQMRQTTKVQAAQRLAGQDAAYHSARGYFDDEMDVASEDEGDRECSTFLTYQDLDALRKASKHHFFTAAWLIHFLVEEAATSRDAM